MGWRAVSQMVVRPAARGWGQRYLRQSIEHALEPERAEAHRNARPGGWGAIGLPLAFLGCVVLGPRLWTAYVDHGWLAAAGLGLVAAVIFGCAGVSGCGSRHPLYDVALVKEKLGRPAARAELRLAVFAPDHVVPG